MVYELISCWIWNSKQKLKQNKTKINLGLLQSLLCQESCPKTVWVTKIKRLLSLIRSLFPPPTTLVERTVIRRGRYKEARGGQEFCRALWLKGKILWPVGQLSRNHKQMNGPVVFITELLRNSEVKLICKAALFRSDFVEGCTTSGGWSLTHEVITIDLDSPQLLREELP